ncbi:glycosyl hydrolase [Bacillus sinesaloumensis]|uniref:glycosyl hydrolase n=1 Tax=Litchfieldia sinesaloumensis TaxID=1926280 RepID=UPI000988600F|nr:glycosyl hydrolase [Bacillus sinesaloumensis]
MPNTLKQQFVHPPEEFTPIPFWFWNDHLTKEEITRQIHDFYNKGVTGFVIHPRIGIPEEIEYLSDSFMEYVQAAVEKAKRLDMTVILYDEAMYPSGSAKGFVVKENPEFASRGLKMIEYPLENKSKIKIGLAEGETFVSAQAVKKTSVSSIDLSTSQVLRFENDHVSFSPPDEGDWIILVFIETYSEGHIRGIHFGEDDGEANAPASTDLLNPEAVRKFIEITHDTYYNKLKNYFGSTIIAMFTDEPDILGRGSSRELKPWTREFLSFYKENGNKEVQLPALWFDVGVETENLRKNYRKAVNKRLTEAYYKQISDWCSNHGIALTGHPEASDDIGLLEHFQIPGQDVVWRWVAPEDGKALEGHHSTAGKCSADSARHRGRRRNLNEFLGVCSKESPWALSPGDMKWYMDWLLVRGVNLLCPHAFYYSIDGQRRSHERPPDVGPNNLWWPHYKQFAQYMKRLSWLMTDSTNQTGVAVLSTEDHLPWKIAKPLFENQVEFNYLEESLFLSSTSIVDGVVNIQNQSYQTIIVEDSTKLDVSVIDKLVTFIRSGGEVIVHSENESTSPIQGAKVIQQIEQVVNALSKLHRKEVVIHPASKDIRVSKVIKEGRLFYLLVNEGENHYSGTLHLKEEGTVEKWDAWTGEIVKLQPFQENSRLAVPLNLERRSSIVYAIDTAHGTEGQVLCPNEDLKIERIPIEHDWIVEDRSGRELESWTKWDGMESFSGEVVYENQFAIEDLSSIVNVTLHLGEVYEIVKASINGKEIGVKMWAPYSFEVNPKDLINGVNHLTVYVTNSRANEMDDARLPSGLLGPVSIELVVRDELGA